MILDDNIWVTIDRLSNKLCSQGSSDEVDVAVWRNLLDALA